jgi:hypothetical protein
MDKEESRILFAKVEAGIKLAIKRLIEQRKKEDGTLVISRNGKVVEVRARDLD